MRKTLFFLLIMLSFGGLAVNAGEFQPQSEAVMYSLQHLSSQKLIAADQLGAYLQGADASEVFLYDGRSLEDFFKTADIAGIGQWTVDAGGGSASGGSFMVMGTAGQPDAGVLGGDYDLNGGFWDEATDLFADGFESGDTSRWSMTVL